MQRKFSIVWTSRWQALLWIALIALVMFGIFSQPRLMLDDWTLIVADGIFDRTSWFDWYQQRPLNSTLYKLAFEMIGDNISDYYWLNYVLVVGIFFLIYLLIDLLLTDLKPIALATAVLALVYPANFTATWLTMINNHLAWLLTLWGIWCLSSYALRDGKWWQLIAGSILIFLPLWTYEGSLGISAAWCVLLLAATKWFPSPGNDPRRRLGLLIPLCLLIIFALLRGFVRPMLGIRGLNTGGMSDLTIGLLLDRAVQVKILVQAWTYPLARFLANMGNSISQIWLLAGMVFGVLLMMLLVSWLLHTRSRLDKVDTPRIFERRIVLRRLVWTMVIACGFIFAGMIPMIFIRPLNLEGVTTRANLYAIPPASLTIVAILGFFAVLLTQNRRSYQWLLWTGVLPLLIFGLGIQFTIQQNWQEAWNKQRAIWHSIFEIAPDLRDNTTVVLVMQGYQNPASGSHPPIYAEWEFEDALKVLYDNQSLEGRIYFPKADFFSESTLAPDGVHGAYLSETSRFEDTVFLIYREAQDQVQLLNNPKKILKLQFDTPGYLPEERIILSDVPNFAYRHLVGKD